MFLLIHFTHHKVELLSTYLFTEGWSKMFRCKERIICSLNAACSLNKISMFTSVLSLRLPTHNSKKKRLILKPMFDLDISSLKCVTSCFMATHKIPTFSRHLMCVQSSVSFRACLCCQKWITLQEKIPWVPVGALHISCLGPNKTQYSSFKRYLV